MKIKKWQMNRLEYTITNLNTTRENMVSAESRIRDLDIAQASSDLAAQQVLVDIWINNQ